MPKNLQSACLILGEYYSKKNKKTVIDMFVHIDYCFLNYNRKEDNREYCK